MLRCNFHTKLIGFCFLALSIFVIEPANGQNSRVSVRGTIEQIIVEESPLRYEYVLAADDGNRYQLSASESVVNYANRKVSLSGVLEGKRLNVNDEIKVVEESKTFSSSMPAPTFGSRKVLTLLVNFTNNQTQPVTVEQVRSNVFTGANSANAYFKEASLYRYNLTGIQRADGDVVGWLTLPFTDASCNVQTEWTQGADALARQNGYESNNYNSVLYVFPTLCGEPSKADLGVIGDTTTLRRAWFTSGAVNNVSAIVHEIGHNLGLNHANALVCSGASIWNSCQDIEYGDPFDRMGRTTLSFFFNNYYRLSLGWLTGRAQIVTTSGDYSLLAPSFPAKGNQVLQIPLKSPNGQLTGLSYFLEFRRRFSFDNPYQNNIDQPVYRGVSIRYTFSELRGSATYLIDTTPNTPANFSDAPLTAGNTFVDSRYGITITTLSTNPMRGARVRIQLSR